MNYFMEIMGRFWDLMSYQQREIRSPHRKGKALHNESNPSALAEARRLKKSRKAAARKAGKVARCHRMINKGRQHPAKRRLSRVSR